MNEFTLYAGAVTRCSLRPPAAAVSKVCLIGAGGVCENTIGCRSGTEMEYMYISKHFFHTYVVLKKIIFSHLYHSFSVFIQSIFLLISVVQMIIVRSLRFAQLEINF